MKFTQDDEGLLTANITCDVSPDWKTENKIGVKDVFRRGAFAWLESEHRLKVQEKVVNLLPSVKKSPIGSQANSCNTTLVIQVDAVTPHIIHQNNLMEEFTESNNRQKKKRSENLTDHNVVHKRRSAAYCNLRKSDARSMNPSVGSLNPAPIYVSSYIGAMAIW